MIRECAHEACGQRFEAKRADARFCSAGCRAAASRARRAGVGPGSGPTSGRRPEGGTGDPEVGPPDGGDRLRALEEKVMDLEADVEAGEYKLQLESSSFPVRGYKRIAVKVVDVYGNESTMVREL